MIYHSETTELNTVSVYTLEEDERFQPTPGHSTALYSADVSTNFSDQFKFSDSERETPLSAHRHEDGYILEQRLKILGISRNVNVCLYVVGFSRLIYMVQFVVYD